MGFFVDESKYKTLVSIDESARVTDIKYTNKPIIIVRSSAEHEQGYSDTSRSVHRAGIKVKGPGYSKYGLEVFTRNGKGEVEATLPPNSEGYQSKRDDLVRKINKDREYRIERNKI